MCVRQNKSKYSLCEWLRRKTAAMALCMGLVAMFICPAVTVAEIQRKSFPLPIRIDHSYRIKSSLYINCGFTQYEQRFPSFMSENTGAREQMFCELVQTMHNKDTSNLLRITSQKTPVDADKAQQILDLYASLFTTDPVGAGVGNLRVIMQFHLGNSGLYIWGIDSPEASGRRPVRNYFRIDSANNQNLWMGVSQDKLSSLLSDVAQSMAKDPNVYVPISNREFVYEYPIAGTVPGEPAFLQFNGRRYDVDIFVDDVSPSDEVLHFYQQAYNVFRTDPRTTFPGYYTEKSRAKYLSWVSGMDQEKFSAYRQELLSKGRRVRFILDADPVYIVFHQSTGNDRTVRPEYIVRDPRSNGELRLTNFYFMSFLDAFIEDRELFYDPILKSILQEAEAMVGEPTN